MTGHDWINMPDGPTPLPIGRLWVCAVCGAEWSSIGKPPTDALVFNYEATRRVTCDELVVESVDIQ